MPSNSDIQVKELGGFRDKFWVPRIWNGMRFSSFFRMFWRNGFLVNPIRWPMAAINMLIASPISSGLHLYQQLAYGRKIREMELKHDPVFIIGHWRSGTTMLHEILIRDPQFSYPDTFSCFAAEHFLVSRRFLTTVLALPNKRPMDNMAFGWTTPQEDEFALCALGVPSPYQHIAFPNNMKWKSHYERMLRYLDLTDISERELASWKNGLMWFIKALAVRDDRRCVLKSPTHTARVRILREMFPNAKFIHISRSPYTMYASTVNLWKRFLKSDSFQWSKGQYLDEFVFESLERMYQAYFRDTADMEPSQLAEIRYEDLCQDKVGTMEKVYAQLELGDFERVRESLVRYAEEKKDYKRNKFEISDELREKISQRWKLYIDRYGE